jgi:hypothetical protein
VDIYTASATGSTRTEAGAEYAIRFLSQTFMVVQMVVGCFDRRKLFIIESSNPITEQFIALAAISFELKYIDSEPFRGMFMVVNKLHRCRVEGRV